MAQSWHDLLFAHWPVAMEQLRRQIPEALAIDTYEGQAWVGVVPFRMSGVRLRAMPAVPGVSAFPELNVRTYVTAEDKPGVWFFSLDAANALAVVVARRWFHLPYYRARMNCERRGEWIEYASERTHRDAPAAELHGCYRAIGQPFEPRAGSLEYFLAERYCLYAANGRGRIYRGEIHHPPWKLQAAEAEWKINSMAAAAGISLPRSEPLLHFAERQDMVAWAPERRGR
jgi:uncharacterized protein YqjF (DUF2071 family)